MNCPLINLTAADAAEKTLSVLQRGGIVAVPTDTVYGLCGRADSAVALARLRQIKSREPEKPFQILLADFAEVKKFAVVEPSVAEILARHWPGALTAILPALLPSAASPVISSNTVGIRLPDFPWLQALLRKLPSGLAATSANRHGAPPARVAAGIAAAFGDEIDLIVDGGELAGAASTVALFTGGGVKILRQGKVRVQS
ncbi:MAG: threonylcarbamoyl-AMP synthase [Planctomycetota bacterium]|jgi:L-threonylcarbamoyladenylate synthase|nr:threonylcarbamoyl-AMP synthase [Planctomycetota bacterium]